MLSLGCHAEQDARDARRVALERHCTATARRTAMQRHDTAVRQSGENEKKSKAAAELKKVFKSFSSARRVEWRRYWQHNPKPKAADDACGQ